MPAAGISQQKGPNSSPGQPTLQKLNKLAMKFCLICHVYLTNHHFFKHLNSFLQGKCFHNQQEAENAFQEFFESQRTDLNATGINKLFSQCKIMLLVMVPILINKDVFEPNY